MPHGNVLVTRVYIVMSFLSGFLGRWLFDVLLGDEEVGILKVGVL